MSKSKKLYNSITNISDQFIEEAQSASPKDRKVKKNIGVKWGAAVVCLCMAVCAVAIPLCNEPSADTEIGAEYPKNFGAAPPYSADSQPSGNQQTLQASDNPESAIATKSTVKPKVDGNFAYQGKSKKSFPSAAAGGIMPGGATLQMPEKENGSAPTVQNGKMADAAPMVYINDTLYQNYTVLNSSEDIKKDLVYLGKVESYVRNGVNDPVPNENFQANTYIIGADINQYGNDIMIEVNDEYWLYKAVNKQEESRPAVKEANPKKANSADDNISY